MSEQNWYTVKGACEFLGLSRMTLLQAEAQGIIHPHRTPGGHRRYSPESLQQYLSAVQQVDTVDNAKNSEPKTNLFFYQLISSWEEGGEIDLVKQLRQSALQTGAEWSACLHYDQSQSRLTLHASYALPHWVRNRLRSIPAGPISQMALESGLPQPFTPFKSDFDLSTPTGSGMAFPLICNNDTIGIWLLFSSKWAALSAPLVQALRLYSRYLAMCTFLEIQEKKMAKLAAENRFFEQITPLKINSSANNHPLETLVNAVNELVEGEATTLFLVDHKNRTCQRFTTSSAPSAQSNYTVPNVDQGVMGWVFRFEKPHISRCLANDSLCQVTDGNHSFHVVLPLLFSNQKEGVMHINTAKILDDDKITSLDLVKKVSTAIEL